MSATLVSERYEAEVPVDSIEPSPDNPNRGRLDVIGESIDQHGFFGAVLCQTSRRRIIAGEHRWKAAKERGAETLPVIWLDVDDDAARRIMLVDNRSGRLGSDDEEQLAALLRSLPDLKGTGYDDRAFKALLRSIEPPSEFPSVGEEVSTTHVCTSCGFRWSRGPNRRRTIGGRDTSPDASAR